ncbi:glycosyltransferase family 4 protein [Terrabacter sp. 2YAF2]|uniref:glycosyltransferase family 4 protein n=1 Tax=Terrabacter sp. 2YAF2 TaxID=3233026 RepID=UPI003F9C1302
MSAPQHLLVVTTNFAETHGGVQAHLAELLPRLVERGVATTVVYLGERTEPYAVDGVSVVPLRRRVDLKDVIGLPGPREWAAFVGRVRRGGLPAGPVSVVATHTRFFPMSALGLRLGHRLGVPVVHTEHGAGSVVTGSALVEAGSRGVDATMGGWVLRHADRVVGVSAEVVGFVRQLAGVDAVMIPNGIDVDRWLGGVEPADAGGGDARPLVFVGRVVAEKGWEDFLSVARTVGERTGVSRPVHVVGDGPDLARAQDTARAWGLDVQWHGRLEPDGIRAALRGAVYVNPSVAAEGFQLTQLEALLSGAAVVSYDVGVARELETSGVGDVHVVPRGDLVRLAEAAVAASGRAPCHPTRAEVLRWDWETVADDYAALLSSAGPR